MKSSGVLGLCFHVTLFTYLLTDVMTLISSGYLMMACCV